jgi:hypothetical protein
MSVVYIHYSFSLVTIQYFQVGINILDILAILAISQAISNLYFNTAQMAKDKNRDKNRR